MIVLNAITPLLMVIALITPIVTGYRREKLGVSIRIGWGLLVFASIFADFIIPELAQLLTGGKAGLFITPNTSIILATVMFGWLYPLVLHYVGFVSNVLVEVLRGPISKARPH